MIRNLYRGGRLKMVEWDVAMVTAADYTVELSIPEGVYDRWYKDEYSKNGGDKDGADFGPAMSLKYALKDLIQKTLDGELKEGSKISSCKIADIQFAFNNHKMIRAL